MTITYPLTPPSTPGIRTSGFKMANAVAISESPFTFEQQAYAHQGERFGPITITMPPMKRDKAGPWIAFFAKLQGRKGTFLMGDPDGKTPQGVATGTPLVNGGSQTGNSLVTDGWTHSVTGILKANDYIQLGSGSTARMYMVLDDVNSDGSGNATLTIWPSLRSTPLDNAAIVVSNCVTQFRLDGDFGWDADLNSVYTWSFSASEALP